MEENNKIAFGEIERLIKSRKIDELYMLIESDLAKVPNSFAVKVTKVRNLGADFSVIVNGKVAIDFGKNNFDQVLNDTIIVIHDPSLNSLCKSNQGDLLSFRVPTWQYEKLENDANKIYSEYCKNGMNFGWIPSNWFKNCHLI